MKDLFKMNPLNEGARYIDFGQKVAKKVSENLAKSKKYTDCSALCFNGSVTCPASLNENNKQIQCAERKKEVLEALKVFSRKIRMELALSKEGPGHGNINFQNALRTPDKKFVNSNLEGFEIGTPNPIGERPLNDWEMKEALRRVQRDRTKVDAENKNDRSKDYTDWAAARIGKLAEHQMNYRNLIYVEAPIFAVIQKAPKFDQDNNPLWTDAQIAQAFSKLSENAELTQNKVLQSMKTSKLEFDRDNGDSLAKWLESQKDLLFYISMKNQVEEVLKADPKLCGTATSMFARLQSKDLQNSAMFFTGSLLGGAVIGGTGRIIGIGSALTGSQATALIGLGLGSVFIGDSIGQYASVKTEALSKSGLGGKEEGTALRTAEDIVNARKGIEANLIFAPLDIAGSWSVGKTLYSSFSKQMAKDLPEISGLMKKAKVDPKIRDEVVDKWLVNKVKSLVKSKVLSPADEKALKQEGANSVLEALTSRIEKTNPDFFKNSRNMDFYLKTAATMIKKEKGDPADLGKKAEEFLLSLDAENLSGGWDPKSQTGIYKLFEATLEELRVAFHKDPAAYAKFTSDSAARDKIVRKALKRAGAKDEDVNDMILCALP